MNTIRRCHFINVSMLCWCTSEISSELEKSRSWPYDHLHLGSWVSWQKVGDSTVHYGLLLGQGYGKQKTLPTKVQALEGKHITQAWWVPWHGFDVNLALFQRFILFFGDYHFMESPIEESTEESFGSIKRYVCFLSVSHYLIWTILCFVRWVSNATRIVSRSIL